MIFLLFIFSLKVFSSDVGGKTILRKLSVAEPQKAWKVNSQTLIREEKVSEPSVKRSRLSRVFEGNLPSDLIRDQSVAIDEPQKVVLISKFGSNPTEILVGDILECIIPQDILGYQGSVSPVRADITEGPYKGFSFIGNVTMDQKTKSLVIEFNKLRSKDKKDLFEIKATVHSVTGEVGLVGTYNSYYWRYFFASVISRGAQGYAEGFVQRDKNILGQYVNVPGSDNSGKIAVVQGGQQTAELLTEQMKQAPEYTTLKGPILTKVFVMESPKLAIRR